MNHALPTGVALAGHRSRPPLVFAARGAEPESATLTLTALMFVMAPAPRVSSTPNCTPYCLLPIAY